MLHGSNTHLYLTRDVAKHSGKNKVAVRSNILGRTKLFGPSLFYQISIIIEAADVSDDLVLRAVTAIRTQVFLLTVGC